MVPRVANSEFRGSSQSLPATACATVVTPLESTSSNDAVNTVATDAVNGQDIHQWDYLERHAWAASSPTSGCLTRPFGDPTFLLMIFLKREHCARCRLWPIWLFHVFLRFIVAALHIHALRFAGFIVLTLQKATRVEEEELGLERAGVNIVIRWSLEKGGWI